MNVGFRRKHRKLVSTEIDPDEIFIDAGNLPKFDEAQFEGRLEKPISRKTVTLVGSIFFLVCIALLSRTWFLQIQEGEAYSALSERNSLRSTVLFAPRGIIEDRNGVVLVSNASSEEHPDFPSREYIDGKGFAHVVGYVSYPQKDASGIFFQREYIGKSGVEAYYDEFLRGINGTKITEENVHGGIESESVVYSPRYGMTLRLSIDSRLQEKLYEFIESLARERGFSGGAAGIMDIENGEMIALTSFPEFNPSVMSEGKDGKAIQDFLTDERQVFLDRAVDGLYTPGSIVKPFVAVGALVEKIISPEKKILSTGSISLPNPYNPSSVSVFRDWKAHGWVNMREALAVSSDVYFYEVGGGFEDQPGLGITKLKKYFELFGFGRSLEHNFLLDKAGTLPDPVWKAAVFDGEPWRIGDTYNTSIGQYGMQVTPIQALRATAAIANGGKLLEPTVIKEGNKGTSFYESLEIAPDIIKVVQEGMRDAVLFGTAANLNISGVKVAAKTGTAELGSRKQYVNSWIEGFFPYENPRYAFVVMMERGPHDNTVGALYVFRQFLDWLVVEAPDYVE